MEADAAVLPRHVRSDANLADQACGGGAHELAPALERADHAERAAVEPPDLEQAPDTAPRFGRARAFPLQKAQEVPLEAVADTQLFAERERHIQARPDGEVLRVGRRRGKERRGGRGDSDEAE